MSSEYPKPTSFSLVVPKLIGLDEGILHPAAELVVPDVEPVLVDEGSPVLPPVPESEEGFDE